MEFKTCTKCGRTFPATTEYFHRHPNARDGLRPECKVCVAAYGHARYEAHKERAAINGCIYRKAHKEQEVAKHHAEYEAHKEEILARHRAYDLAHKEEKAARGRAWRETHREQARISARLRYHQNRDYLSECRQANPKLRLGHGVTGAIGTSLHGNKAGRHWESLVGYTLEDLMHYLKARFQPGMTWQNYGRFGWHIDHVKPIASFSFESPDDPQFKECWALSNLQPMWAHDNLQKGTRESALLATDQRLRRRRAR